MLHIKLKETERRAPCKHTLCPYTHPRPVGLGQNIFSKCGYDAYQMKGKEVSTNIEDENVLTHTPDSWSG